MTALPPDRYSFDGHDYPRLSAEGDWVFYDEHIAFVNTLERAIQAEREQCAKVARSFGYGHGIGPIIADAIIARGQKESGE